MPPYRATVEVQTEEGLELVRMEALTPQDLIEALVKQVKRMAPSATDEGK